MMVTVTRTELFEVEKNQALSLLCHQVKNLYNRANYIMKQKQKNKIFSSYNDLDRTLKSENCYRLLPAHTAQLTLKLLVRNWKAYFRARKEWQNHPEKFLGFPRPPKHKPSNGEHIAILSNQQARIVNGWLILPKKVSFTLKTRLNSRHNLREVRVVPRGVGYTIEIVYHKILPKSKKKHPKRKGAIDLGLTNLVTFVDNIGSSPIIVKDEGKRVKSITQYYLKKVSELQEQYSQQQRKEARTETQIELWIFLLSY